MAQVFSLKAKFLFVNLLHKLDYTLGIYFKIKNVLLFVLVSSSYYKKENSGR